MRAHGISQMAVVVEEANPSPPALDAGGAPMMRMRSATLSTASRNDASRSRSRSARSLSIESLIERWTNLFLDR